VSQQSSPSVITERQADIPPGDYLLHGYGTKPLKNVKVIKYNLRVAGGIRDSGKRRKFTSSAAYYLDNAHGVPVASAGNMSVISVTSLTQSVEVWGKTVKPVEDSRLTLDPAKAQDRKKIRSFVQSCFKRAIPQKTYSFRFLNEILRNEPAFTTGTQGFAALPKHEVKIQVTAEGQVLVHVESGYSIQSNSTLDQIYSEGDYLPNRKVAHEPDRYNNKGQGWLQGWSEYRYNDLIDDAGSSVAEMHDGVADEEWRTRLKEENPRLMEVKYGGYVGNQAAHFLRLSPRLDQVKEQDYEFFSRFNSRKAMMPGERFKYTKEFIENLSRLPVIELDIEPGPINDPYHPIRIRDENKRLVFGKNNYAHNPSQGLRNYGVYKSPTPYRVGVLAPERWNELTGKFTPLLVKGLNNISTPAGVSAYEYELGNVSNYTPVVHDLHEETDAVVAVVPDEEAADDFPGIDDPHHELKRTLLRKGIPTQMMQKSTVEEVVEARANEGNDKFLNVLSAVVAKAGGTPWQIDSLPGATDAFMGLDVTRDDDSGQHSGASASVVLADGTTFAAESTTQQEGEKFAAKHVEQFIRDLVVDFAAEQGREINRLCVMRDGKVQEDIGAVREGLSDLDAEIDIVGVRKRDQPRVAEFDGTRFRIAEKGVAFVDKARNQSIVHAFGKPEVRDNNPVGTPRTFRLMKHSGPSDIETLTRQAYWLSEVHVGSPARSPRLPIPIEYADMAAEYVSDGLVSPGTVIKGPAYI